MSLLPPYVEKLTLSKFMEVNKGETHALWLSSFVRPPPWKISSVNLRQGELNYSRLRNWLHLS